MWITASKEQKIIENFVIELGFSEEAARLYTILAERGPLTLLEASRRTEMERTGLYRLVEKLVGEGLLERVMAHKSQKIAAVGLATIRRMVELRKKEASRLEIGLETFEQVVGGLSHQAETQVKYYKGVEGIKQILWNETKAKGEVLGYLYRNLQEVVGKAYFSEYARELEKNTVKLRDLRTESFLQSTRASGYRRDPIDGGYWRYIPEKILKVTHIMDIYDDVVAIYYWQDNDVFGVEIQNKQIAETQRSIFEALWGLAANYKLPKEYDTAQFKHLRQKS